MIITNNFVPFFKFTFIRQIMIKNFFKIAWRNLLKQKGLSFISIFGLSLGIACFSLFALYAWNEFHFDSFHQNAKNIYRVYTWTEASNGSEASGSILTPMPLAPAMKHDLPDVENVTRYLQPYEVYVNSGDKAWRENLGFADPSFFSIFSFKLKYGNAATALDGLHNMVLTESTADKLFGRADVTGKTIEVKVGDQFEPFTISAVAEDPPSNSSFQFTMLAGFDYLKTTPFGKRSATRWIGLFPYLTFVQLKPGSRLPADPQSLAGFRKM
jgi:putative ABC transport system permease protein